MYKKIVAGALAFALVFGISGTLGGVDKGVFTVNASAEEMPTSGKCGENLTWKLDADGTLTISGTGEMDFGDSGSPWASNPNIKKVVIQNGVTNIEWSAFDGCRDLIYVYIPKSVKNIGMNAFCMTKWLENKQVENPLVVVNNILIDGKNCEGKVTIPTSVTSIGVATFSNCTNLTDIKIPNSVMSIGSSAFFRCTNLNSIDIPDSVTRIDYGTFNECINLTKIDISNSIKIIGEYAFFNCEKLSEVRIPESVSEIGDKAFGYYYKDGIREKVNERKIEDFTIKGVKGSAAEKYAKDNGFKFVELKKTVSVGDANGDNEINVSDIAVSAAHIKGIKPLTDEQQKAADVNDDDKVNVTDIAMIASHIKGIKALK